MTDRDRYHPRAAKRALPFLTAALLLLFLSACGREAVRQPIDSFRFAVIGNTLPESPYKSVSPHVAPAVSRINEDNPLLVIHLGDMVHGGAEWMGIKKDDIARQFREFFHAFSRLRPLLYTAKGEMDLLDGSGDIYTRRTGRKVFYSFNYGSVHFIILDTTDPAPGGISGRQMDWLARDLEEYRESQAMFVFAHHPLYLPAGALSVDQAARCKNADDLHRLLARYPVKAVFSGHTLNFYREKKDDILYVTAGCGGYNVKERYGIRQNQYYLVEYGSGGVIITPRTVP